MLVITVELAPGGDMTSRRHLGTMLIVNDGSGSATTGNYDVTLSKWGRPASIWKRGRVEGFPRQHQGAFDLMLRALESAVGARWKERERALPLPGRQADRRSLARTAVRSGAAAERDGAGGER